MNKNSRVVTRREEMLRFLKLRELILKFPEWLGVSIGKFTGYR